MCENSKENLETKVHQQEVEMATLKKESKLMHSQLLSEQKENKKLRVEKSELQLLYAGLESQYNKMKVDTAMLEEGNKYNVLFNQVFVMIFCLYLFVV